MKVYDLMSWNHLWLSLGGLHCWLSFPWSQFGLGWSKGLPLSSDVPW